MLAVVLRLTACVLSCGAVFGRPYYHIVGMTNRILLASDSRGDPSIMVKLYILINIKGLLKYIYMRLVRKVRILLEAPFLSVAG